MTHRCTLQTPRELKGILWWKGESIRRENLLTMTHDAGSRGSYIKSARSQARPLGNQRPAALGSPGAAAPLNHRAQKRVESLDLLAPPYIRGQFAHYLNEWLTSLELNSLENGRLDKFVSKASLDKFVSNYRKWGIPGVCLSLLKINILKNYCDLESSLITSETNRAGGRSVSPSTSPCALRSDHLEMTT